MAQVTTTHFKIFEYWRDKAIKKNGNVISTRDMSLIEDAEVIEDWFYPCCWACGRPVVRESRMDKLIDKTCFGQDNEVDLKKLWSADETKKGFERCHIVPGTLGGKDEPNNLFLMCRECHHLSPDTKYPSVFFKWVYKQRKKYIWGKWSPWYILSEVDKALKEENGVSLAELLERIHNLGGDDKLTGLKDFMHGRISTHCTSIVESTAIAANKLFLLNLYVDLCLGSAEAHGIQE